MTLNNNNSSTPHRDTISIDEVLCSNVQISTTGIEKIRQETSKYVTLQHLKRIITYGLPETGRECSKNLHMFWNYRDELSVENQMVFKGDRIVVPATLQHTILRHLHEGHMGLEKMLLRTRSAVFWPGLTAHVNNMTKNCETCQNMHPNNVMNKYLFMSQQQQNFGLNLLQIYVISKGNLT